MRRAPEARTRPGATRAIALGCVLGAVATVGAAGVARAGEPVAPWPRRLVDRAAALLAEAAAAREPVRRPPTPTKVTWKARRIDALDLGAPLLDLTAGDLDGDGRAELIAVTERAVVVLAPQGRRALVEVARLALSTEAPATEPRDPMATIVVAPTGRGVEVRARASTAAEPVRATLAQGQLRAVAAGDDVGAGYPLCADRVGARAPGRAYFERADGDGLPEAWPARYWAARCDDALVDAVGRPMRVDAVLGDGGALQVTVHVRCRADEADCVADRALALDGVGVAYAIADVDHDGRAEVITSAASAPGDPDAVTVHALPARGTKVGKALFTKRFTGGVGGVAAADVDGDGDVEVFAAVRLAGSQRVDLWLLD